MELYQLDKHGLKKYCEDITLVNNVANHHFILLKNNNSVQVGKIPLCM